ncbi:MAG: gliding motility protein GldM [Bacteroidales bacterium]|nr:gliding motility protein GldM [Bacteroidales bacterium]
MAREKLSIRQKMIGMMYLILTAMLALNVSKEAVEAFKKVDNGLIQTLANYTTKNTLIYRGFDLAAKVNPEKVGKYQTAAYRVKTCADTAINFLQNLKIEIIKAAEGEETPAVKGKEIIIDEVKRIDDINIPSHILIGANENGKATDLKAKINDYCDSLIAIASFDGKDPPRVDALRKSLNTDDFKNKAGITERWENVTFQNLPLVAVITIMSKMQIDVKNAETEVLNYLYTQIDASWFKFDELEAIVMPVSNYVIQGQDYEARVFISARDSKQSPVITVENAVLPLDSTGKGIYKVQASSTGAKKWGGIVALRAPDGTIMNFAFKSSYTVGEPNVVVSPTAMNVMYMGIPNPIDVSVPGVSPNSIEFTVVNGTLTNERVRNSNGQNFRGSWAVKPNAVGQNVQVIVKADINGNPMQYPPYEFRVKSVPDPVAVFAGRSIGTIPLVTACAQQGVFAEMRDFDFDLHYTVTGFSVLYSSKGFDYVEASTSSNLTKKQRDLICGLESGDNLIIKDIRAIGPEGNTRKLLSIILRIE